MIGGGGNTNLDCGISDLSCLKNKEEGTGETFYIKGKQDTHMQGVSLN